MLMRSTPANKRANNHDQVIDSTSCSVLSNVQDVTEFRSEVRITCTTMTAKNKFRGGPYHNSKNEIAFVPGDKVEILGEVPEPGSDRIVTFRVNCGTDSPRKNRVFKRHFNEIEPELNKDSLDEKVVRFAVSRRGIVKKSKPFHVYAIEFGQKKSGNVNIVWISAQSRFLKSNPEQPSVNQTNKREEEEEEESESSIKEGERRGQVFGNQEVQQTAQPLWPSLYYCISPSAEQLIEREHELQAREQTNFLQPQVSEVPRTEGRGALNSNREGIQQACPAPPLTSRSLVYLLPRSFLYDIPQSAQIFGGPEATQLSFSPPPLASQLLPTTAQMQRSQVTRTGSMSPPVMSPFTPLGAGAHIPQIPPTLLRV